MTIEILREGKSVTTLETRLWQDGAVQTILVASFGVPRASNIKVRHEPIVPVYRQPEELQPIPFARQMPECYQHFDVCWAEGRILLQEVSMLTLEDGQGLILISMKIVK